MNRDLLELYSDYLLSAFSYTTATGLSAMTNGAISHDKITRFLAGKELDSAELWRVVKPLVHELDEGDKRDELLGVLIIDSLAKSPTKTIRTQSNHFFACIYAFVKLERIKIAMKTNHFALRSRIYLKAIQAAYKELRRMQVPELDVDCV